jgi:hypothetical protein
MNSSKQNIDSALNQATNNLNETYLKDRTLLSSGYETSLKRVSDTILAKKLTRYNSELINITNIIDSLRSTLKKLDDSDLKNVDTVRNIFVEDSTGIVLLKKIRLTYTLALEISKHNDLKNEIITSQSKFFDPSDIKEMLRFHFGQATPQMAIWTLYGYEQEILEVGIKSFKVVGD